VQGESVERDRLWENKKREGYKRKSYESEKRGRERERERETSLKGCQKEREKRDMIKRDRLRDISRDQCWQRYVERYTSREKYVEVNKSSERSRAKAVERDKHWSQE
jgi:hypothetical protein